MTAVELTSLEQNACTTFMETFLREDAESETCPFRSFCFSVTKEEVEGEVIDVVYRYLSCNKNCPQVLIASLVYMVKSKFLLKDLQQFELERHIENEIVQYNVNSIKLVLFEILKDVINGLLQNGGISKLQKTSQFCHVSVHAIKNKRRTMEDRHVFYQDLNTMFGIEQAPYNQSLFAVFDGHGGTDAANYAASQMICNLHSIAPSQQGQDLCEAIVKTDANFVNKAKQQKLRSGATAVVALIQGMNLSIGWLGDSQVVLCKAGNAIQLMDPHKPNRQDEKERIEKLGGCVMFFGGWRVNGQLAVSRAIGDYEQKPYVTGEPEVEVFEMEGDEEFLIVGCDGLWDTVEPFDAVQAVQECTSSNERDEAAEKLVNLAKNNKSIDNITVMVVYLDFLTSQSKTESNHVS